MGAAAATPQRAAPTVVARAPEPGSSHRRVQTALKISNPNDAAEREAEATARAVMAMPAPAVTARARVPMLAARAPAAAPAPKAKKDETSPELTEAIKSELGRGKTLPKETREFLEPRFRANFAGVRIHTDGKAENLATRLGARAFAYGRDIFFNAGAFQPDTPEGMELIAHELTHTIQQREVVQREVQVTQHSEPQVQRGIVSEALDWIADKANVIPGYRLFTIVIGRNPINMEKVERSGANILRALIEFIPGGGLIVQALENHGIFEKGGKFIEEQFAALGDLGAAMRDALMEFIDSLGWRDIFRLGSLWGRAKRIFTVPVDKAISFGKNLVSGIAQIVKDAIIKPLGRWAAANIPKWDLLVGVFGKNPISDEGESPASALIGGFMNLIGQGEIWENIKKGNAIAKAWQWFQGAMKGALSLVTSIPGRVMGVIRSLTIFDIVTIAGAFSKIFSAFASFVGDFMRWAGGTVLQLLEIIFSVVAPSVVPYLKKAGGAFSTIIKAPGRFIATLVKAGKQGFNQFKTKFVTYLRDALFKWLLGAEGGGIYFPKSFAPLELLKLGLSVLGLTWANVRAKLVAATNETVVKALETGFDIVKKLVTEGPAAAWEELLKSLSNLKSMVVDAAIDFVKGEVVKIAIEKLVSFLTPAGAFIQAVIAIFRTIMFVVNKLSEIGRLVAAFIDSLAAMAAGNVAPAANKVESVLATGLSLAISFLANFAGLGNIPKKVMALIKKIRDPVDKALDKVVTWIVAQARRLGRFVAQAGVPHDPAQRLRLGLNAADTAVNALSGDVVTAGMINPVLRLIKTRYAFTTLAAVERDGDWWVQGTINPAGGKKTRKRASAAGIKQATLIIGQNIASATMPLEYRKVNYEVMAGAGTIVDIQRSGRGYSAPELSCDAGGLIKRGRGLRRADYALIALYNTEIARIATDIGAALRGNPASLVSGLNQRVMQEGGAGFASGIRAQMRAIITFLKGPDRLTFTGIEVPYSTKHTIDYTLVEMRGKRKINVAVEVKNWSGADDLQEKATRLTNHLQHYIDGLRTGTVLYDELRIQWIGWDKLPANARRRYKGIITRAKAKAAAAGITMIF